MGQIRLWVEPCEGQQRTLPLPEHWEELDEDEKRGWAKARLEEFVTGNVKFGFLVLNDV